jgi:hypothetical protein
MLRRTDMRLPFGLAFGALLALCAAPVYSTEYLPLALGNRWSYETVEGSTDVQTVVGTTSIWGTSTYVIDYTESTFNEGLENYWTSGADGDVILWGFYRSIGEFGVLYDPPVLGVDAPLFVGKTWTVQTNIYELPDTTFLAPSTLVFTVYEDTALALPAGVFQAFGIGYVWDSPMSTSLTGTLSRTLRGAEASDWYSDGTGLVQYSSGSQLFQLTGLDVPTSASNTSWGAIKGLFK